MNEIGGVKNGLAFFNNDRRLAMVKHGRGKQADTGMMMLLVVPVEEIHGIVTAFSTAASSRRKNWTNRSNRPKGIQFGGGQRMSLGAAIHADAQR